MKKQPSHRVILSSMMLGLCLSLMTLAHADEGDERRLETIHQQWEEARGQYRDALTDKRDAVNDEIGRLGDAIISENDRDERDQLMEERERLIEEREELSDRIRIIAAGDVVRFSNNKNNFISFFTRQR